MFLGAKLTNIADVDRLQYPLGMCTCIRFAIYIDLCLVFQIPVS